MDQEGEKSDKGLQEGAIYPFKIKKQIIVPGSGEEHFVLLGPETKRYLLKCSYYSHYGMKVGAKINCSVDKINCTGQIFLEPQHPYYTPGQRYDFLVTRISTESNIWGNVSYIAWVKDLHRYEWPCQIDQPEYLEPGMSHLSCRVERIKKGQLILSLPSMRGVQVKLRRNTVYDFTIKEVREFKSDLYYVIEDPFGSYHPLLKKNYEQFNYQTGQAIQVRVIDLHIDGTYILEPLNPYYRINEVYLFKFLRIERMISTEIDNKSGVIWVEDHFGQAIKVKPKLWQMKEKFYNPEHIICKVTKFKKGRLLLENLAEANEN